MFVVMLVLLFFFAVVTVHWPIWRGRCVSWLATIPIAVLYFPLLLTLTVIVRILRQLRILPEPQILPLQDMRGKTCVITGCNTGIGKETALGLAKLGATVVMVCRSHSRALQAKRDIEQQLHKTRRLNLFSSSARLEICTLDLSSLDSIPESMAVLTAMCADGIDVLVCNAGLNAHKRSPDGLNIAFQVNYLAHFAVVQQLLPLLRKRALTTGTPSRIVTLSSVMQYWGSVRDISHSAYDMKQSRYPDSKLAMSVLAREINRREAQRTTAGQAPGGVTGPGQVTGRVVALAVNPGGVSSDIWRGTTGFARRVFDAVTGLVFLTPPQGAAPSLYAAASGDVDLNNPPFITPYFVVPGFRLPFELLGPFAGARACKPWLLADDELQGHTLWTQSEQLLKNRKSS